MLHIDRDDPTARRTQVRLEPKQWAIVLEKIVVCVLLVQELDHFRVRLAQIFIGDAVLRIGPLRDGDD